MNKQIVLNILRTELKAEEDNLLFHKAEIAHLWDICDPAKKNNPYVETAFYNLNKHKELARQTKRRLKSIRDSISIIKKVVGVIHV